MKRSVHLSSHKDMLMCRSCFCQLITGVLSFRCCLSWHAELSKGLWWKWGYVCPSSVIHPPRGLAGSAVMVQWTLSCSCAGLFWGSVGRLTGLLWYPSQRGGPPPSPPSAGYTEKCYRGELAVPRLSVICTSLPILEIGGEGVWIVPLQKHSAQDFSKPTYKNKFTS